jgi:hypothetical protein
MTEDQAPHLGALSRGLEADWASDSVRFELTGDAALVAQAAKALESLPE